LRRVVKHAQRIAAAFAILGVVCTASGCGGGGGGQTYYPDNSNYTQSGGPSGSYGLTGPYTTTAGSLYNVTVDLNNYSLAQDSFASGVLEDPYTYNIGFALTAPAAFFPSGWAAATYDSFSASEGGVIDQLSSEYEVDAEGSKIGFDWQSSYNHQFYVVYPYDSTSAGWYIASWGYAMPASQDYQDVEDTLNYYTTADQSLSAKVVQDDAGTYDVITPDQPTFALGSDVYWQTTSFNSYAEAVAFIYNSYDDSDTGRRLAMAAMNKLVYDVSGVYVLFYPTLGSSQAPAAGKQAPLAVVNNQGKVVLVLRAPKDGSTIWTAVRPRDPNKPHARPLFDQVSGTNAPAFQQALDGSLTARTEQLRIP
ncbi:MAG: hypothetical protein KGK30_09995, partial [Elusimicrobia bacterium]|nr:hypothetical protein [Elusimicrobiota bacterium]